MNTNWEERALNAERQLENFKMVNSYAKDIINLWPSVTLKTLYKVTSLVTAMKEAVSLTDD